MTRKNSKGGRFIPPVNFCPECGAEEGRAWNPRKCAECIGALDNEPTLILSGRPKTTKSSPQMGDAIPY